MTISITEFITARLDEDAALATAAANDSYGEDCWFDTGNEHIADHYLRHGTARVLREVAAKRAILAVYRPSGDPHPGLPCTESIEHDPEGLHWDDSMGPCERHVQAMRERRDQPSVGKYALWCLASAYSDHPDFDPEWSNA